MTQQNSLAENVVDSLSLVRAIGKGIDGDHPMRHVVRNMGRVSELILANACNQVRDIAYQAEMLVEDYDKSVKEVTRA